MFSISELARAVIVAAGNKLFGPMPAKDANGVLLQSQWLGQHTNPARNEQRQVLKAIGRRQYKKRMHAARMAAKKGRA